jgi:hypothetical protein
MGIDDVCVSDKECKVSVSEDGAVILERRKAPLDVQENISLKINE